jgi:RNA-directed DNA polymerase
MINRNGDNQQLLLDIFRAYFDTRKNKGSTVNALEFEKNYESKLFKLYRDIMNREYKIGQSICFIVDKPVKREIFAADFRDRVVHHLIFNYINPIFEKHFIGDSYSCRLGKGTSKGIEMVDHFIRSSSENYEKDCWILKLDIKGYFMAMDRNILYRKIEDKLKTVKNADFDIDLVLYLIRAVVFNDPTKNFCAKGKREDWIGLPKSKSLFFAKEGKGFPVGNLTSQLFGNIYLDDFDHFVCEGIGAERYGRYVDDMVFVHSDREFLKSIVPEIRDYLQKELELELHPKKIYLQNSKKGVGFLGTFVKPWRIYIGKRTKQNFYAKKEMWNEVAKKNHGLGSEEEAEKFVACVNSYLGIMKHYDTNKIRKKMARSFCGEISKSIVFSENFGKVRIEQKIS